MDGLLRDLQAAGYIDSDLSHVDVDMHRLERDLSRMGVSVDYSMLAAGTLEIDRDTLPYCPNRKPRKVGRKVRVRR